MDNQPVRHDQTLTLPDGRALAYDKYGDPAGTPIIFFGGTPTGRLLDPGRINGVAPGIRVIGFDRPGYGGSDFYTGWRALECAEDVAHLADHLGIARFAVVGYSGGGQYAAGCAAGWPERVTALGLASGVAPAPGDRTGAPEPGPDAAGDPLRQAEWPAFLAEFEQQNAAGPAHLLKAFPSIEPESGKRLLAQPAVHAAFAASLPEAVRHGLRGWAWDEWVQSRPWGFAVEDIAVPTYVWHGEQDRIVPVEQGRYLASTIPGAQGRFYPDGGHTIFLAYWNEILATLVG